MTEDAIELGPAGPGPVVALVGPPAIPFVAVFGHPRVRVVEAPIGELAQALAVAWDASLQLGNVRDAFEVTTSHGSELSLVNAIAGEVGQSPTGGIGGSPALVDLDAFWEFEPRHSAGPAGAFRYMLASQVAVALINWHRECVNAGLRQARDRLTDWDAVERWCDYVG